MNCLAIDTSGEHLTVLIVKDGIPYTFYSEDCGVRHSVSLMTETEKLANKVGFDFKSADFFAVVIGAGSFTGIRIGVSTVKALCFSYKKPCLSVTSFDALAYNKIEQKKSVLAVIDAKHNGYYACGYDKDMKVIYEPSYILYDDLMKISGDYDLTVAKTDIEKVNAIGVSLKDGLYKAILNLSDKVTDDLDLITPLYCRKSQAEEGRL